MVTTRSKANQPGRSPSPPPRAKSPKKVKGSPKSDDYNRQLCQVFIDNPNRNPFTGVKIDFMGPRFMKLNEKCQRIVGISIDLNKYVEEKLDQDFNLAFKLRNSIKSKTTIKMKNYFYNERLTDIESLDYLKHAYQYINTDNFKVSLDVYLFAFFKNNKKILIDFINEYLKVFIYNKEDFDFKIRENNFTFRINDRLTTLVLENAATNGIHPITDIPYPQVLLNLDNSRDIVHMNYNNYQNLRHQIVNRLIHIENPDKIELKKYIDGSKKILDYQYITSEQRLDFEEIYNELLTIYQRLNKSKTKSISSPSTAHSGNKSQEFPSTKKQGLPLLSDKTRDKILEDVLKHSKEDRDMITLRHFKDMKKKDLQTVVRIGSKTRDNLQNTYSVVSIYKLIHSQVKANLAPKDPLNPSHIITNEEMIDIQEKIQYYRRGAPRPDSINQYIYPKVEVIFDENGKWEPSYDTFVNYPGLYTIIIRHTIGNISTDKYWGSIKYIDSDETGEPDLNTGTILEAIRKIHDEGRLLKKEYQFNKMKFIPRVHINKEPKYWNIDYIAKLRLMKQELETYYRFNTTL